MEKWIFYILVFWNSSVFVLYGIDKLQAVHNRYRISEKTLLLSSFLGGAFGGSLGMFLFHHKVRKPRFLIVNSLSLCFLLWIVFFLYK